MAAGKEYEVTLRFPEEAAPADAAGTETDETPAAPPRITVEDRGSGQRSMVPVYVGAGLTAVGLGAWIGFGIDAGNAREDIERLGARVGEHGCSAGTAAQEECSRSQSLLDRQRRSGIIGNVGMGVALTAGVATVAYLLFWPERKPTEVGMVLHPVVAADHTGGSVGLRGEF